MAMQLSFDEKRRQASSGSEDTEFRTFATLVIVRSIAAIERLGCIGAQAFAKIRAAQTRGSKRKQMKLVESLALGNRRQLLLVVCDNRRYLVGAGAESVGSIHAVGVGHKTRERTARGPELVRRRGRDASPESRPKAVVEAGLDLWP